MNIHEYTVEPPRSGQSRPNSVRISEFHLVSNAKPVKRTKSLLGPTCVRVSCQLLSSVSLSFLLC